MGLFKKKESVHFARDEEGRVVEVQRSGDIPRERKESRTPAADSLIGRGTQFHKQQRAERSARREQRVQKFNQVLDSLTAPPPRRKPAARKVYRPASGIAGNYNPFGSMFDTGMKNYSPSKKRKKTSYVIKDGIAYPKAGSVVKKKKKSVGKPRSGKQWDIFDNHGYW